MYIHWLLLHEGNIDEICFCSYVVVSAKSRKDERPRACAPNLDARAYSHDQVLRDAKERMRRRTKNQIKSVKNTTRSREVSCTGWGFWGVRISKEKMNVGLIPHKAQAETHIADTQSKETSLSLTSESKQPYCVSISMDDAELWKYLQTYSTANIGTESSEDSLRPPVLESKALSSIQS